MQDSDWLFVLALVVWLLVELLASPPAAEGSSDTVESTLSNATGGRVIHEHAAPSAIKAAPRRGWG